MNCRLKKDRTGGGSRTHDLLIHSQALYPSELLQHVREYRFYDLNKQLFFDRIKHFNARIVVILFKRN